ncbi:MAG: hypothetical protein SFZ02_08285 [bacterium]|nr:hypothetical protein [bacterium]
MGQMVKTQSEDMREALLALGYIKIMPEDTPESIEFYVFESQENNISKFIIAAYYHESLTLKSINPLFKQGRDVMLAQLEKNPATKVAFLVLLSKGVSPGIIVIRAFTEPVIRITSDRKLKPTVIYAEKKSGLRTLEVLAKLMRGVLKNSELDFDKGYDEDSVAGAHKRALHLAN